MADLHRLKDARFESTLVACGVALGWTSSKLGMAISALRMRATLVLAPPTGGFDLHREKLALPRGEGVVALARQVEMATVVAEVLKRGTSSLFHQE